MSVGKSKTLRNAQGSAENLSQEERFEGKCVEFEEQFKLLSLLTVRV